MKAYPWTVIPVFPFLSALQRVVLDDNGLGVIVAKRQKLLYQNGMLRTFWTRKQAQARADELNAMYQLVH